MTDTPPAAPPFSPRPPEATAALVLADSTVLWGKGVGAHGAAVGEVVFNTSMTGYQEVLTDPSYAGQIITFTFPHIGNVGANPEDIETVTPAARGAILRADITDPSNWRATRHLDAWMSSLGIIGISGIDTRALTRRIRDSGAPSGLIIYPRDGQFDLPALSRQAQEWPGLEGMDLAKDVSCAQTHEWEETAWALGQGYGHLSNPQHHVVAVDFGAKRNILRCLASAGCRVTVVPAQSTTEDVMRHKPDGVFLSNGPGDPMATGVYAVPMIQGVMAENVPLFGICLGHQMLALALGGKTSKMDTGHRGANHPVKDLETGKVEITSQNHGFVVVEDSLPAGVRVTHRSLFDGSVEGLAVEGRPVFSVQYHPEASPGPRDSHYLFQRFVEMLDKKKNLASDMPKRTDIKSILIIGAGPIVIGQACEFDYSGVQACKALKEEGYRIILVNSNPATIMTDPGLADATYIEPITPATVERIMEKERPDALLPTMGGQTALNTAMALADQGVLERLGVEMIAAKRDVIAKAEDRLLFRDAMDKIGLESPRSQMVRNLAEARDALAVIGLPAIIRPSFTLAGTGGGIAYNSEEFEQIVSGGLTASPTSEVLVEESVLGWKEYEMEVVRDKNDNCIIICSIENIDPMGVHTGDSVTVAPALTLTDKEYQIMRDASIAVLREIGVDTGGSNVQFAVNPVDGRMVVIEMNPRVSRSSALASKATGFPIAKIAAKLAVGYTLDELANDITGVTPASFEPTIDYVVTKIPRFTFEKFPGAEPTLTTSMKSVGEAMSIGRNFQESLQKGLCSMETGLTGLDEVEIVGADGGRNKGAVKAALSQPRPDRILTIAQAFRFGLTVEEIYTCCSYDRWFLEQIKALVETEAEVRRNGLPKDGPGLLKLKKMGFSDARLAILTGSTALDVAKCRDALNVHPVFKRIDTCAAEFPSTTPYLYSCYEGDGLTAPECEADVSDRDKVIILGGGPNRIGQGIEFDYCCVHAAYALSDAGKETIMVNCNPETVSTDYDTSDRLYFEPLTAETVTALVRREQTKGRVLGVIVQFGGQTPLKLAAALERAGIPILGTSPDAIDLAEDRERFQALLHKLGLRQPDNGTARSEQEASDIAEKIGFPVVIRPSYVLGGRAMRIVHDQEGLRRYMKEAVHVTGDSPVLIDRYLSDAIEVDVDCLSDKNDVYVAGIMEHIEEAGIHSGDSACSLPPHSLAPAIITEIKRQTGMLARALDVVGLMNVQFAVKDGDIYILEVNPRASRTVPFVAKATGIPIAKIAARVMGGETLASFNLVEKVLGHVAVKEAVFPFARFPGVDILLGPEMKSTGEVMGIDTDFRRAFAKSQLASGMPLPESGTALLSVRDADKPALEEIARLLIKLDFKLLATAGTASFLRERGIEVKHINKVLEGRPHCVDAMLSSQVQLVVNTTDGAQALTDSFSIRRTAFTRAIPHYTTMSSARVAVEAIDALRGGALDVAPLQSYFNSSF